MSFQAFLLRTLDFVNDTLIPFILALAFLFFIFNIARYFWAKDTEEAREEASRNALWGILGFVVIVSIWGIVNMLVGGLGFGRQHAPCPDYNPNCNTQIDNLNFDKDPTEDGPECINGTVCTFDASGVRTCFAC